jgi:hypothetical protein
MNFLKFLFLALLVYLAVYYLFSPYQQCIREFDGSSIAINDFDGSPDQIQTQRRELLNIAKDGHKLEFANTHQW